MNPARQRAGQLGGIATRMKYGDGYLRELGKLGGRQKLSTLKERRQQAASKLERTEDGHRPALKDLTKWFKVRYQNNLAGS